MNTQWMDEYSAFFFDLDGLLVDSEPLHFKSFLKSCQKFGWTCPWDFTTYCLIAHTADRSALKEKVSAEYPPLRDVWEEFRAGIKTFYLGILKESSLPLMPGVETFLRLLKEKDAPCCVVTNSSKDEVELILKKLPFLQEHIKIWLTRETYSHAKPHPDPYHTALKRLNVLGKAIGFEDSPRGLHSLKSAGVTPVWIRSFGDKTIEDLNRFTSFEDLLDKGL